MSKYKIGQRVRVGTVTTNNPMYRELQGCPAVVTDMDPDNDRVEDPRQRWYDVRAEPSGAPLALTEDEIDPAQILPLTQYPDV